jgi:predicted nucleic acid-binding protein
MLVLDSSAIVALLVDGGVNGDWVAATIGGQRLAAPSLAVFETANILRRQQLSGRLERVEATLGHADLLSLPLELWPYAPLAERAWALRETLTSYDASYVALAELLDAPLVTLDDRLRRASGPTCAFRTPP